MLTLSRTSLSRLFVGSLTIASNACASNVDATLPVDPSTIGGTEITVVTSDTAAPAATPALGLDAYAAEFKPVDGYAKAMPPGVELLGFIDYDFSSTPTCSTGACSKEWKDLIVKSGAHSAIVRRGGKLEAIMLDDFTDVIGLVDSPDKAALRARMDEYRKVGRCSDFSAAGFACGTAGYGIAVRTTENGFEVVTFGPRNVCGGIQQGNTTVIGIVSIDPAGRLAIVDNDLTQSVDKKAMTGVQCSYPTRGRMFEGFVDCAEERSELEYFLRAAHQEAAAVVAFERLARELSLHGAPRALIVEAERSARDERRHARSFQREAARVAAALGIELTPPEPAQPALETRPLRAVLEENAAEGCVNETYAAVVATHQAVAAKSPRLQRLFGAIAADEQRHAALAFRVHAWGVARLDLAEREALEQSLARATREMLATPGASRIGLAMGEPLRDLAAGAFAHVSTALRAAA